MKNKVKDLMKDMNKSFVDQIVDATDKVSRDFNKIKNEEVTPTNDSIHQQMDVKIEKDVLDSLKQLTADLKKQAIEKGLRNLEEKRVIRDMWGRKYVFAKWYNKWYYRIKFKRSVTEYMLCAGEQYYLENEFFDVFKPLENIEEIFNSKKEI